MNRVRNIQNKFSFFLLIIIINYINLRAALRLVASRTQPQSHEYCQQLKTNDRNVLLGKKNTKHDFLWFPRKVIKTFRSDFFFAWFISIFRLSLSHWYWGYYKSWCSLLFSNTKEFDYLTPPTHLSSDRWAIQQDYRVSRVYMRKRYIRGSHSKSHIAMRCRCDDVWTVTYDCHLLSSSAQQDASFSAVMWQISKIDFFPSRVIYSRLSLIVFL